MNNIANWDKCSNCGACINACPFDALYLDKNSLFYTVKVEPNKCVNCGKCIRVCPTMQNKKTDAPLSAWWGYALNEQTVKCSSSGGIFSVVADYILRENGIVYGAAFSEDCKEVVITSSDHVPLDALRRSKYVESLVGNSFRSVRKELETGRLVLYCGTPCQIAGLKSFLNTDYPNLYTCDFACGGLSSHLIYQDHLRLLEERYNSKVKTVNFRPKNYGWSIYSISVHFENGKKYEVPGVLDPFLCSFLREHVNVRDYCYECKFAEQHASDLILADFWKFKEIVGQTHDNTGISLVLVNSEKGQYLLNQVKSAMTLSEVDLNKASYNLRSPDYPVSLMELREKYLEEFKRSGVLQAAKVIKKPEGFAAAKIRVKCMLRGLINRFK